MTPHDCKPIFDVRGIFKAQGCIIAFGYLLTEALSLASVGHWLRAFPRCIRVLTFAYDEPNDKVVAWWQDAVAALLLLPTPFLLNLASSPQFLWACIARWVSVYLLADAVLYHVRVLWFDDLRPGISQVRAQVWSHRRVLFVLALHYVQSIYLFAAIYTSRQRLQLPSDGQPLWRSFSNATLMSLAADPGVTDALQILVSLFFIGVAIATMASVSYRRSEAS